MRVKAMQQVIDSQTERIAALAAEKEAVALGHHDESTGQGNTVDSSPHLPVILVQVIRPGLLIVSCAVVVSSPDLIRQSALELVLGLGPRLVQ